LVCNEKGLFGLELRDEPYKRIILSVDRYKQWAERIKKLLLNTIKPLSVKKGIRLKHNKSLTATFLVTSHLRGYNQRLDILLYSFKTLRMTRSRALFQPLGSG